MAKHRKRDVWHKVVDNLLGDEETKEDNRAYREQLRKYHESAEYQESLLGFKDIGRLITGVFRRNRHGRH